VSGMAAGDAPSWSRRSFLRGTVLVGGLAAVPGTLAGCAAFGAGSTLERIRKEGVVRVGIAGERPYAYIQNGKLVGGTAAVHQAVFDRIGDIEVRGVPTLFKELIDGLNAGNFDAIGAGMFITADRCDRAIFSDPVYCAKSALLVRVDNPKNLSDYASVARQNASLAVLAGGVEGDYARAIGVSEQRLRTVGTQQQGLELVAAREADAFTLTSLSLRTLLRRAQQEAASPSPVGDENLAAQVKLLDPFTPVVDGTEQLGCGAAAFRTSDEELRDAFNEALGALRREGRVLGLMSSYGFTPAETPEAGVTTEELCRTGGVTGEELDPLPR
jgi:polar amino acid transport system substrate-binding protein